jgi:hypothetical protein
VFGNSEKFSNNLMYFIIVFILYEYILKEKSVSLMV